jgi:hypothetical protein
MSAFSHACNLGSCGRTQAAPPTPHLTTDDLARYSASEVLFRNVRAAFRGWKLSIVFLGFPSRGILYLVFQYSHFYMAEVKYVQYEHALEGQYLPAIRALISKDLSEPYGVFVYRYFLYQWGHLCFMVFASQPLTVSLA